MPSQQSSFRGTRTTFTPCQEVMAATEASSEGPSKGPKPCTQAYSVPDRLTPWSWRVDPAASTRRLPETRAARVAGVVGFGAGAGVVGGGEGVVTLALGVGA